MEVSGARGRAPGKAYKVCATYVDGFRCDAQLSIVGVDAVAKAERTAQAILARTRKLSRTTAGATTVAPASRCWERSPVLGHMLPRATPARR